MESSSENSFAWTDTSSDSTSMAADDANEKSDENYDFDNDKKKKIKMSLTRKVASDGSIITDYKEDIKGEHSNKFSDIKRVNKKMIKLEPESDNDRPKKNKKIKHNEFNGNKNDSQDSISYDETYLNMKVKQEQLDSLSTKQKQQPDQLTSLIYQNVSINENIQESEHDTKLNNSKKKKKKAKRKYDSEDIEITSKVDIDETVVNKKDLVKENKTFYEENEESGCDEISAIKYDDEHNLHTISIINQSLRDVDKTKIDNSFDETTSSRHKIKKSSHREENHMEKPKATRTQKISDRIRFEDDDDIMNSSRIGVHENDFEISKKSAKLEQFVRGNTNLRLLSKKIDNNTRLTSDDEIWILKCPKDIDIKDFKNISLNVHSKFKIKIAGQTYDGSAEEHSSTVPLLTIENNKYKIRNSALSAIVSLRKRIPKAHFHDHNIMVNNQTNFIPLPDTKCRHPLFGSNYKKALKIPTAIAERLKVQDVQESVMKVERRKKKKEKKNSNKTDTMEHVNPQEHRNLIMKLDPNDSVEIAQKKKQKRKFVDDENPPKKVKRMKHDLESAEAWESEKAIEENLFNF